MRSAARATAASARNRQPHTHRAALTARQVHATGAQAATPIPHPPAPGPPPKPPVPAPTFEGDRVARKRKQAGLVALGQQLKADAAKPGTALQKRFWKDVSVATNADGDFQILLDARPVRTPTRKALTIPSTKPALAAAIAVEWDSLVNAAQALKQHYIPLTGLAARALDIADADAGGNTTLRAGLVDALLGYLKTDTLLCWVPEGAARDSPTSSTGLGNGNSNSNNSGSSRDSLRSRQERIARPITAHLCSAVWPGATLVPVLESDSIVPRPQPAETTAAIRRWMAALPAFELAGLERAVLASKSLCVAARLVAQWGAALEGGVAVDGGDVFGVEEAAEACSQEVLWQTQMWGEVEDTHDVDREDVRRQLGSVVLLVHGVRKSQGGA